MFLFHLYGYILTASVIFQISKSLPDLKTSEPKCFGVYSNYTNLQLECQTGSTIAIKNLKVGAKKSSSGCQTSFSDPSAYDTCCTESQEDCILNFDTRFNDNYHTKCNGNPNCSIAAERMEVLNRNCTNEAEYLPTTSYMFINYYCIPDKYVGDVNNADMAIRDSALYLSSPGFPSETPDGTATDFTCSVESDNCGAAIHVYTLQRELAEDANNVYDQTLSILDESDTLVEQWTFNNNTLDGSMFRVSSSFITVKFSNNRTQAGGKFWLGFQASQSSNLTLMCPAMSQQHCVTTTSTTSTTTTTSAPSTTSTATSTTSTSTTTSTATTATSITSTQTSKIPSRTTTTSTLTPSNESRTIPTSTSISSLSTEVITYAFVTQSSDLDDEVKVVIITLAVLSSVLLLLFVIIVCCRVFCVDSSADLIKDLPLKKMYDQNGLSTSGDGSNDMTNGSSKSFNHLIKAQHAHEANGSTGDSTTISTVSDQDIGIYQTDLRECIQTNIEGDNIEIKSGITTSELIRGGVQVMAAHPNNQSEKSSILVGNGDVLNGNVEKTEAKKANTVGGNLKRKMIQTKFMGNKPRDIKRGFSVKAKKVFARNKASRIAPLKTTTYDSKQMTINDDALKETYSLFQTDDELAIEDTPESFQHFTKTGHLYNNDEYLYFEQKLEGIEKEQVFLQTRLEKVQRKMAAAFFADELAEERLMRQILKTKSKLKGKVTQ